METQDKLLAGIAIMLWILLAVTGSPTTAPRDRCAETLEGDPVYLREVEGAVVSDRWQCRGVPIRGIVVSPKCVVRLQGLAVSKQGDALWLEAAERADYCQPVR